MKYIVGIDSGGTKYLVKACDLMGNPIAQYIEYAEITRTNRLFTTEGMSQRVSRNIDRCLAAFNGKRENCVYMVCGTTGIDSESDYVRINNVYQNLDGFNCPVLCINDAEAAHFAATGGIGVAVIAGTGSIAFGRNSRKETTRSGGWSISIFGDDGSGTWISRKALYHLTLWFDGRVPSSPLVDLLFESLKIGKREELIEISVQIQKREWKNPGLSALVDKAAARGDKYAIKILRDAAGCTFDLADSVITKLKLNEEPTFKVGAWGSAIVKSPLHFSCFKKKIETKYNNANVVIPKADAATGACMIGLERIGRGI